MATQCFILKCALTRTGGVTPITVAEAQDLERQWNSGIQRFGGEKMSYMSFPVRRGTGSYRLEIRLGTEESEDTIADWFENMINTINIFEWWELWYHWCLNDERKPCEPWRKIREGVGT